MCCEPYIAGLNQTHVFDSGCFGAYFFSILLLCYSRALLLACLDSADAGPEGSEGGLSFSSFVLDLAKILGDHTVREVSDSLSFSVLCWPLRLYSYLSGMSV